VRIVTPHIEIIQRMMTELCHRHFVHRALIDPSPSPDKLELAQLSRHDRMG
jgi:hypothetical protein